MVRRNPDIAKLQGGYLFPEINRRKQAFLQQRPQAKLISLGIGDTTQPIPAEAVEGFVKAARDLGDPAHYTGYGPEKGLALLRERIADRVYQNRVLPEEIFVSDGAKCDLGRLQALFGRGVTIGLQDPAYPVYVDSAVIGGITGEFSNGSYEGITYLSCNPGNAFFPDLEKAARTDLLYFCSPNNPTGAVATRQQLETLVAFAKNNRSIIIYDSAYAPFIQGDEHPRSIFEIPGAREVALEVGSFSKLAGFTGVRLGWTVVPKELQFEEGASVRTDWERIHTTIFNGASNIAQHGGMALLTEKGLQQTQEVLEYYRENAAILKAAVLKQGCEVYGGDHAPYLWVKFPGKKSWEAFDWLLDELELITTPGVGFGPSGEGFVRMSALGKRADIIEAARRLAQIRNKMKAPCS